MSETAGISSNNYLDSIIGTPRISQMARKARPANRKGVVEDHRLVAFPALRRDVPSLQRSAVVRRNDEVGSSRSCGSRPACRD